MHDCGMYRDSIWEAADAGEVSVELAAVIRRCDICRRELDRAESAALGFEAMRTADAPEVTCSVPSSTKARRGWFRPVYALAPAALLVAAAGVFLLTVPSAHRTAPASSLVAPKPAPRQAAVSVPDNPVPAPLAARNSDASPPQEPKPVARLPRPAQPVRRQAAAPERRLVPCEEPAPAPCVPALRPRMEIATHSELGERVVAVEIVCGEAGTLVKTLPCGYVARREEPRHIEARRVPDM